MSTPDLPPRRLSILLLSFWLGTLGAAYLGLLAFMIFIVPQFEMRLVEMRLRLPYPTEVVIAASRWCVRYWYVPTLMVVGAYAYGGAMLGWLRPTEKWKKPLWIAWLLLAAVAVAMFAVVHISLTVFPAM